MDNLFCLEVEEVKAQEFFCNDETIWKQGVSLSKAKR